MDQTPSIVMTLLGAVSILATAIAAMYKERIKAAQLEIERLMKESTDDARRYEARITKLEGDLDATRERYEAELGEERTARRVEAQALAKTSTDIIMKGASIVDLLTKGGRR